MKELIQFASIALLFISCAAKFTKTTKSSVLKDLEGMVEIDQIAASRWQPEWKSYKDSVFSTHKVQVEKIFNRYGFLGYDKVGKEASNQFWLIVQHCDKFPEFQKRVLAEMNKQVKKQNADPNNYAYLYDRVEVNAGRKQSFGTQVDYEVDKAGRAFPKYGLVDSINVEKRRKEYGLESLKEYLNMMTTMHYDMNKESYQSKGIMKPDLN
jgi:hypothetical protein